MARQVNESVLTFLDGGLGPRGLALVECLPLFLNPGVPALLGLEVGGEDP